MPIAAAWRNTMATAKPLVEDHPRRAKLIALALAWEEKARTRDAEWQAQNDAANRRRDWLTSKGLDPEYPTPRAIIEQVAFWHDLPVADIVRTSREHHLVEPHTDAICAIWLNCRRKDGHRLPMAAIGRHMGHRHHTTILYTLRRRGLIPQRGGAGVCALPAED